MARLGGRTTAGTGDVSVRAGGRANRRRDHRDLAGFNSSSRARAMLP